MKKFGGDPVVWPEFYETFKVSVHENGDLSDVERFSYLKHYVFGEAASCIQGLPLSSDNYSEALKLLEDRFGNRQLIVAKHMNALLDLARVHSSTSVKELRSLFDKITVNIRALRALGISSEQFGPMLSPVIMKTLPEDMKLEISRRLGGRWKIDEILSVLGVEIKTREAFAGPPREENRRRERKDRDHREPPPRTTESLAVNSRDVRNCVFCDAVHPLEKCPLSVSERYEAAKKGRLCFRCLGSRHSAKACKSKSKCSSCNGNRHHSALCNSTGAPPLPKVTEPEVTNDGGATIDDATTASCTSETVPSAPVSMSATIVNRNPVFLQTIRVAVSSGAGNMCAEANILFDLGSQKTYIRENLVSRLNLKPAKREP